MFIFIFIFFLIFKIEANHKKSPEQRLAQKALAEALLNMIHGSTKGVADPAEAAKILFETDFSTFKGLDVHELDKIFVKIPNKHVISKEQLLKSGGLIDLLFAFKVNNTKSEIRRNIDMGGLYVNSERKGLEQIKAEDKSMLEHYFLGGKYLVARIGKKNFAVIEIN